MTDYLRVVHRYLASVGMPRSRFSRGQWSRGYLAEIIGSRILVHWFGRDPRLATCERVLAEAGFIIEHVTNAAGDDALSLTVPSASSSRHVEQLKEDE